MFEDSVRRGCMYAMACMYVQVTWRLWGRCADN